MQCLPSVRHDIATLPVAQWAHHAVGDGAKSAIYRAHYHAKVNNDGPPPLLPRESVPIASPHSMHIARTTLQHEGDPAVHVERNYFGGDVEHRQGVPGGEHLHNIDMFTTFRRRDQQLFDRHLEAAHKRALARR